MAKRSEFAQKLLDDLRIRKEGMCSGQATQPRPAAAQEGSRWSLRGSGERISRKTSGQMPGVEITRKTQSISSSRTPIQGVASKEIVAIATAGRSKQVMDLSRGLKIALTCGGTNLNWDLYSSSTNKGFILQQTPVNIRGRENRHQPSTVPYVSQIHIEEISKCAEKINKILRACSNGFKLDRESVDVGRELLRGAIDLEESLRMLASLQEASEYMVNTQRKQVRLIKEKEDEDEPSKAKAEQKMILSRPVFSLYGTKHSLEDDRQKGKMSFLDTGKPTIEKKPGKYKDKSNKISYQRSTSSGPTFRPDTPFSANTNDSNSEKVRTSSASKAFMETASRLSTTKHTNDTRQLVSQDNSGHKRARIPNVIAKLMGLEDFPLTNKSEKHKVALSTQETRSTTNSKPNAEENEGVHMTTLAKNTSLKKEVQRKLIQEKESATIQATENIELMKNKEKTVLNILNPESARPKTKSSERLLFKDVQTDIDEKRKLLLKKKRMAIDETGTKEKENETQAVQDPPFDLHTATGKSYRHQHNEHRNQQFPVSVQNAQAAKVFLMQDSQLKHTFDARPTQRNSVQQSESRPNISKKEQHVKKESELTNLRRGSPAKTKNTRSTHDIRYERLVTKSTSIIVSKRGSKNVIDKNQVKNSLKNGHLENTIIRSTRTIDHQFDKKLANVGEPDRTSKKDSKPKKENTNPLVPTCTSFLSIMKEQNTRAGPHETGNVEKIQRETVGSQSPDDKDQPVEQHTSIFQERTQEEESNSRDGNGIMSLHSAQAEQHLLQKAQATPHHNNPVIGDCTSPKEKTGEIDTNTHEAIDHATTLRQLPGISIREDEDPCFLNVMENSVPGSTNSRQQHTSNCNSFKQHDQTVSTFNIQELPTDDENHLRETLLRSQVFLNNVQALFSIEIPVGIIQAGKSGCEGEQSKITLDCGYEVMRRKGKRDEHALLSPIKILCSSVKVRSLDDLIKELNKDLKRLKFSCSNEEYVDISEFLHKMLERDIYDKHPDVNCMWDLSWKSLMFASPEKNEVVKDVEKHVLNSLINDIVKDLLNVSIST